MSITIGQISVNTPLNYIHEPIKMENRRRSLDGSMLITYAVTTGDVAVSKYHFEVPGIVKSERQDIRAEALRTVNVNYIDNILIPEVFSTTASTGMVIINLQRALGSTAGTTNAINCLFNGTAQTVTISTGTAPTSGNVFINLDGRMTFGPCAASTQNIIINYIPEYTVHILNDDQEWIVKNPSGEKISRYRIVVEEV